MTTDPMERIDPMDAAKLAGAVDPETGQPRCTAHSRNGERCKQPPVPGATVCRFHGGSAPQVRKRAALRLMELIDPAIATLAREMVNATDSSDRQRAANSILDRAGVPRKQSISVEDARDLLTQKLLEMRGNQ